jgi:multidrug efflux pump subunit AcrA (membrane-fusion protein)
VTVRASLSLALGIVLIAAALGCGDESPALLTGVATPPSVVTTMPTSADPTGDVPGASVSVPPGVDASGVGAELDAMEKELDQMDMPSDGDFTNAEGALY